MLVRYMEAHGAARVGDEVQMDPIYALPLLAAGIVRPVHRSRDKAIPDAPERAVKR